MGPNTYVAQTLKVLVDLLTSIGDFLKLAAWKVTHEPLWAGVAGGVVLLLIVLIVLRKKKAAD